MFMTRRLLASLCVTAMAFVVVARAEPPKVDPKKDDAKTKLENSAEEQDRLKRQFEELKQSLLRLAQRLESRSNPDDKEKAQVIKNALAKAGELDINSKFNSLITTLKAANTFKDIDALEKVLDTNDALRKDIDVIIELLMKDNDAAAKKEKERQIREMLERLKEIINKQERVRQQTDLGRKDAKDLGDAQKNVRDDTKGIFDPNAKKDNPGGEAKKGEFKPAGDMKGGNKPGESKPDAEKPKGDQRPGDGKNDDGKEGKPGDSKDGKGADSKDAKPGDGKKGDGSKENKPGDGKGGDGKDSKDSKPGDGKGNDSGKEGKPGDSKEGKGGDSKEGKPSDGKGGDGKDSKDGKPGDGKGGDSKEGKPSDGKDGGKPGDGKPGDSKSDGSKSGDNKPGSGKPGEGNKPAQGNKPGEGKPGGKPGDANKPGEGKPGAGKPGDAKPGDGKGGQGKPSEGKPGSDSKGKGDGKGDAKPGDGKGGMGEGKPSDSKGGQGGQGSGSGQGKPGDGGGSGGPQPPQPPQPPQETTPARKKIEEAIKNQEKAIEELKKENKQAAGGNQDQALKDLNDAKKKLEDLLRQLREEEIERILALLQARCEQMLALQIKVRDDTVTLDKAIKANDDKKPSRADYQTGLTLGDKEQEISRMAEKAIAIIEAEGTAVAFAEVFHQVHTDMKTVEARLRRTDAGVVTVTIENDIIATLEEMIDALKKARQENKPKPPQPPKPGQSGPKPPDQLINELQELKMIRSMQEKVNKRTTVYGRQYDGEQVPAPETAQDPETRKQLERIAEELKDLGVRQDKIKKVTHDIATGKNKAQ
jgi:hypothetical protein